MHLSSAIVGGLRCSEDDYCELEKTVFGRWEYIQGLTRAMSGGSDDHNTIVVKVGAALRSALAPRGYRVYIADMEVHTGDGIDTCPDGAVVCGRRSYHRGRQDITTNPRLVVEVLSETTWAYDPGEKFDHYPTIPSLVDYLLVAPEEARVMLFSREADRWSLRTVTGHEGSVELPSVGVTLPLTDACALLAQS